MHRCTSALPCICVGCLLLSPFFGSSLAVPLLCSSFYCFLFSFLLFSCLTFFLPLYSYISFIISVGVFVSLLRFLFLLHRDVSLSVCRSMRYSVNLSSTPSAFRPLALSTPMHSRHSLRRGTHSSSNNMVSHSHSLSGFQIAFNKSRECFCLYVALI